ncbi:hypothetical protein NPS33_21285 [Pseudomonas putida]|uniref:hypothetical protein n=1 Tax=Pseudomonas putida TaxID=303 RepID=UPI0023638B45|nr:hypothetical protein [Pseudomonas putida]MDD2017414.1 hypothetical protein [Pseudomonas putida]HDS1774036.1 hypothetical protein [Pseudomonas putida]
MQSNTPEFQAALLAKQTKQLLEQALKAYNTAPAECKDMTRQDVIDFEYLHNKAVTLATPN